MDIVHQTVQPKNITMTITADGSLYYYIVDKKYNRVRRVFKYDIFMEYIAMFIGL